MTITEARLGHVRVADVMHTGLLTTDAGTPLRTVARLMSSQNIHAVAVANPDNARRPFGFIFAMDIAAAASAQIEETAGQAARTEVFTVTVDESLPVAAQLMVSRSVSHLIVVDSDTGHPCGVISTLDIAAAYGA